LPFDAIIAITIATRHREQFADELSGSNEVVVSRLSIIISMTRASLAILGFLLAGEAYGFAKPIPLCALLTHPNEHMGKRVVVRGIIEQLEHGIYLVDSECEHSGIDFLGTTPTAYRAAGGTTGHGVLATVEGKLVMLNEHDSDISPYPAFVARRVRYQTAERGWLFGSAGIVRDNGFLVDAENVELVIACKGQKAIAQADEFGDYGAQLEHCMYRLIEVIGPSGTPLAISPRQTRTFTIKNGRRTRFDVMISPIAPPLPKRGQ